MPLPSSQLEDAHEHLNAHATRATAAEHEVEGLVKRASDLEMENKRLESLVNEFEGQLACGQSELAQQLKDKSVEVIQLNDHLRNTKLQIKCLEDRIHEKDDEVVALQGKLQNTRDHVNEVDSRNGELSSRVVELTDKVSPIPQRARMHVHVHQTPSL